MMNTVPQTPAHRMIDRFGADALSRWSGRHVSRVHAWTWPRAKRGTGGVVPHAVRQRIIDGARRDLGSVLTFADFEPAAGETLLLEGAR